MSLILRVFLELLSGVGTAQEAEWSLSRLSRNTKRFPFGLLPIFEVLLILFFEKSFSLLSHLKTSLCTGLGRPDDISSPVPYCGVETTVTVTVTTQIIKCQIPSGVKLSV